MYLITPSSSWRVYFLVRLWSWIVFDVDSVPKNSIPDVMKTVYEFPTVATKRIYSYPFVFGFIEKIVDLLVLMQLLPMPQNVDSVDSLVV